MADTIRDKEFVKGDDAFFAFGHGLRPFGLVEIVRDALRDQEGIFTDFDRVTHRGKTGRLTALFVAIIDSLTFAMTIFADQDSGAAFELFYRLFECDWFHDICRFPGFPVDDNSHKEGLTSIRDNRQSSICLISL